MTERIGKYYIATLFNKVLCRSVTLCTFGNTGFNLNSVFGKSEIFACLLERIDEVGIVSGKVIM